MIDQIEEILEYLDPTPLREGLKGTPRRVRDAWFHFTKGHLVNIEELFTVFEDGAENYNEMILVKNIPVYSNCEHHLVPFFGVAHVAYIPRGKIVGLSKINRLVDAFARRLQVQERLTTQIADTMVQYLDPVGTGIVIECRHLCMEARGVCQQGHTTITSALRGEFEKPEVRSEFLRLIK